MTFQKKKKKEEEKCEILMEHGSIHDPVKFNPRLLSGKTETIKGINKMRLTKLELNLPANKTTTKENHRGRYIKTRTKGNHRGIIEERQCILSLLKVIRFLFGLTRWLGLIALILANPYGQMA